HVRGHDLAGEHDRAEERPEIARLELEIGIRVEEQKSQEGQGHRHDLPACRAQARNESIDERDEDHGRPGDERRAWRADGGEADRLDEIPRPHEETRQRAVPERGAVQIPEPLPGDGGDQDRGDGEAERHDIVGIEDAERGAEQGERRPPDDRDEDEGAFREAALRAGLRRNQRRARREGRAFSALMEKERLSSSTARFTFRRATWGGTKSFRWAKFRMPRMPACTMRSATAWAARAGTAMTPISIPRRSVSSRSASTFRMWRSRQRCPTRSSLTSKMAAKSKPCRLNSL